MNSNIKTTRQTQLPLIPSTEGGIPQAKPAVLSARWITENGQLVCRWIAE